jgi:hypothetical protein
MTINVIGLGETLLLYKQSDAITVGVNDIHSRIKTDFVVCVDVPSAFNDQRLETIKQTNCRGFYSQLDEWSNLPNFKKIEFNRGRGLLDGIDSEKFCYSNSSPYVAVILAYKLGAKKIVIYGADYKTHKHFKDDSLRRVLNDFEALRKALNARGVNLFVCDKFSELSKVLPIYIEE